MSDRVRSFSSSSSSRLEYDWDVLLSLCDREPVLATGCTGSAPPAAPSFAAGWRSPAGTFGRAPSEPSGQEQQASDDSSLSLLHTMITSSMGPSHPDEDEPEDEREEEREDEPGDEETEQDEGVEPDDASGELQLKL